MSLILILPQALYLKIKLSIDRTTSRILTVILKQKQTKVIMLS